MSSAPYVLGIALALAACSEDPPAGYAEGEKAADWELTDNAGKTRALHENAGKVIFFEEGSMW